MTALDSSTLRGDSLIMHCVKCGTELLPGKQFCHACGARAPVTCSSCGASVDAAFKFCPDCGAALADAAAAPRPSRPPAPASPTVPEELAAKIRATGSAIAGERKQVTVLFCDLAGSTAMAERLDPEEYHDLLDRYLELAFREIYRFEGIVNQIAGDGFMALFGAPIAHEDAPQRAVRAALQIQRALIQLNEKLLAERGLELRARIGINTGPVVVGNVGNDLKMDYTAIGDTTNLAARLESLADPGSVLMSESTSRLVRGLFRVRPLGPLAIKGKSAPVAVFEVLAANDASNPMALAAARGLTPYVGRDSELAQLEGCFQRVAEEFPQVVAIVGPAGSGKSRLTYELKARLGNQPVLFLEARCSAWNQMVPYAPYVAMLKQYFGIGSEDTVDVARGRIRQRLQDLGGDLVQEEDLLCNLLGVGGAGFSDTAPEEMKRQTFSAAHRLFLAENTRQPMVMILEDLQWMDEPSREMLDAALLVMARNAEMVLITHRPEFQKVWQTPAAYTQIQLRPLSDDEVCVIACAVAGGPVAPDLMRLIQSKSEGSPFLVEEITRSLLEDGTLSMNGEHTARSADDIRIPGTVQEVVAARLDRLGSGAKRVVQVAAVLGRQFNRNQLMQLLESEAIDVGVELDALERRGVVHRKNLFSSDEYRFGESITQEVAYEGLLLKQRRQLHEHIAQLLEASPGEPSTERAALLAHHYSRSDNREKTVHALLAAAHNAERVPSFATAAKLYVQAWDTLAADFDRPAATPALQQLGLDAVIGIGRMTVIYTAPEPPGLDDIFSRARRVAAALSDYARLANLLTFSGMTLMGRNREQFAAGVALIEEGLATAQQTGSTAVTVGISRGLAWSYLLDGRFDLALRTIRWVAAQLEQMGAAEQLTDIYLGTLYLVDRILFYRGELDEALAGASATYEKAVKVNNRTVQSGSAGTRAQIHLARGEYADAIEWAKRSAQVAKAIGNVSACRTAIAVKVLAMVARGETIPGVHDAVASDHDLTRDSDFGISIHLVISALAAAGELELAERTARVAFSRAAGQLREMLSTLALADALSHRDAERWPEAERWYERAIALAESIGAKSTLAAARIGAGALAQRRGEHATAAHQLRQGQRLSREMGMSHYAVQAESLLTAAATAAAPAQPMA